MVAGIRGVQTRHMRISFYIFYFQFRPIELTWSRTHTVHPDSILDLLVRQSPGKGNDSSLCGCIIKQIRATDIVVDRSAVDYRGAVLQMRNRVLGEIEDGMDVSIEGAFPLRPIETC